MLGPLTYCLQPWQQEALAAWRQSESPTLGSRHGVAEVFTGAGKTILAMACMADAKAERPGIRFAIVVPTCAIAKQWQRSLAKGFGIPETEIGLRMSGKRGSLSSREIVIYVINSGRRCLAQETKGREVMLVVDECHRAGSKENMKIFRASTVFRLGLSATAGRDDMFDEVGNLVPADQQPHIKALGPICYRLDLRRARELGLLPRYVIHHHRLPLSESEEKKYAELCREVQDLKDDLRRTGVSPEACSKYCTRPPPNASQAQIKAAKALQAAVFRRKQWLYGVSSRNTVARHVLAEAAKRFNELRVQLRGLAFNERIDPWHDPALSSGDDATNEPDGLNDDETIQEEGPNEEQETLESTEASGAAALWEGLQIDARAGLLQLPRGDASIGIYHSRLSKREREKALYDFGQGITSLMVSVKALIEGLDVPDANIGLSVASTSSGRQRIQTMGRILRVPRDSDGRPLGPEAQAKMPPKEIHLLYIGNTVDEEIYLKTNWSDLTGEAENKWWQWSLTKKNPEVLADADPPKPPPTEDEAWGMIAQGPLPAPWTGSTRGSRWSYRQQSIFSEINTEVIEPKQAVDLLEAASSKLGDCRGKFVVTPKLHIILKRVGDKTNWLAIGRLDGPLTAKPRERRSSTAQRPSHKPIANSQENIAAQAPWVPTMTDALINVALSGTITAANVTDLRATQHFPDAIGEAIEVFVTAAPAKREPSELLTKPLLIEALVSFRHNAIERASQCAAAIHGRREPWAIQLAVAMDQAISVLRNQPPPKQNSSVYPTPTDQ